MHGPASDQVIHPSHQKNPHGLLGLVVVHIPSVLQGWESGTRDGHPVHMQTVWGTSHARLLGPVKIMELTVSQAHIEAVPWCRFVGPLAGGAHVGPVGCGALDPLHVPDLPGGEVKVVDGDTRQRLGLPIAADIALRTGHAGAGLGVELYYNYRAISLPELDL